MVLTSSLMTQHPRSDAEHEKTRRTINEFDKALKDLHSSAQRLQIAADRYRERLEGAHDR